jgi:hypothetical protein
LPIRKAGHDAFDQIVGAVMRYGVALGPHITVHRLMSASGRGLVAVRPDGYVGFRCQIADLAQLQTWFARIGAARFTFQ